MSEIYHQYGQPLKLTPSGGLAMVDGNIQGQQKVIRRLLTSSGDLLADLSYGCGIPMMVGSPGNTDSIKAIIVQQMKQETIVVKSPGPRIGVTDDPGTGLYQAAITYTDNTTLEANQVRLPISK